jgi:hypothetical protein
MRRTCLNPINAPVLYFAAQPEIIVRLARKLVV